MKVFAISDFHLSINNPKPMNIFGTSWDNYLETISEDWAKRVSDIDIVLIAGDISWAMYLKMPFPIWNTYRLSKAAKYCYAAITTIGGNPFLPFALFCRRECMLCKTTV